uniref:Uncharacterized protein n=1 Tax=Panagrolaimus sp. JU765 TaxID=591449 RepID=A0AC34RFU3_9BILA
MGDSAISTSTMDDNLEDELERWQQLCGTRHTHPFKWSNELKRQRYGQSYSFKVDLFNLNRNKTLYQRDVKGHHGCVNAVEFSKDGTLIASGGDDLGIFIWNAHDAYSAIKPKPRAIMSKKHLSNIFTLAFSKDGRRIFSAGNDGYLLVHDIETKEKITTFDGSCFYSISLRNDDDNVVAAATDAGRIYLFDVRQSPNDPVQTIRERGEIYCVAFNPKEPYYLAACNKLKGLSIFDTIRERGEIYCVAFNPKEPYYLAACNKLKGLSIFDVRVSDDFFRRANPETRKTIFASWDSYGEGLFCIRSGGTPYYLNTNKNVPLVFSDPKYRNKVTIKSCEIVNDEYGFSGSDDWNIYCWKINRDYDEPSDEKQTFVKLPETEKAFTVLKGHRSIVNHVRHSPTEDTIISSGVEKIVKVWSGYHLPGSIRDPPRRPRYGHHTVV